MNDEIRKLVCSLTESQFKSLVCECRLVRSRAMLEALAALYRDLPLGARLGVKRAIAGACEPAEEQER